MGIKYTARAGWRNRTDEFTILKHDILMVTLTRDEARKVMKDLYHLLDEPIVIPGPKETV